MIDKIISKRTSVLMVLGVLLALVGAGTALAAKPVDTTSTIGSPSGPTVAAETDVTITGHVETSDSEPVTGGKIQIRELMLDGLGVPCDTEVAEYVSLNGGGDPPDDNGDVNVLFDTTGLGGSVIGFQSHYIPMGSGYAQSKSECVDLVITDRQALPRGTVSWTQGYFHHTGEVLTCEVLATMDSNPLAAMSVDAVSGITAILGSDSVGVDMAGVDVDVTTLESEDVYRLCVFLVGEVGSKDKTFLPAGKVDGKPVSNLAAQDITLRLNLNLDLVYGEWGVDDDVEFRPIYLDYYLNIDPVPDPAGYIVYPLQNTYGDEALGACGTVDATVEGLCSTGLAKLTALGALVQRLDDAGTTVGDMLLAADALLLSGATAETDPYTINTVRLTQIDVINILSLINKSYDEGIPTGFVTNGDPD